MHSKPILTDTSVATGAIAAHRFVTFGGAQAGAGATAKGISNYAASGAGKALAVTVLGSEKLEVGAAVAAGDVLKSDAQGRGIPQAGAGTILARALTAAGAAGGFVEALLLPSTAAA